MTLQFKGAAKRLVISLLLACGLGGCAVYGPPYGTYDYSNPYAYGRPAYVYPPVSLDLGFTYFDHGPRYHGGHRWGHHHRGHHNWRGHHRGHGGHHHHRGFGGRGRR